MIDPPVLRGRERYERVTDGWVDNTHVEAFTYTVRISDPERSVEASVVAEPSPTYEIREAACRPLAGEVDAAVIERFGRLAGVRMVAGLTRRVAETLGRGAGVPLLVDAAIEAARLARQVAKFPRERAERTAGGNAWEAWQLDMVAWAGQPDSCFTYSAAGRELFQRRAVTTPMHPDLYSPRAGQARVFVRRKVARLERAGGRLRAVHSMHDNAHGFEITYELDLETGRIVRAESLTPRLPYTGICSEPQGRIRALLGETVDDGLPKRLQALLGGVSGCAQLYDLTADLLKLLAATSRPEPR
ncbi:MAG: DUF2889 domain-containing protein [Candidatus Rokubacteria bacterium]|nr:DUF2889 domain-containing protein [Candidatus Rokubacteria bacterium]